MPLFEVTYRAAGPWVSGSRVEALVTIPVKLPSSAHPRFREQEALNAAEADWEPLAEILEAVAGGAELDVSTEVRRL